MNMMIKNGNFSRHDDAKKGESKDVVVNSTKRF